MWSESTFTASGRAQLEGRDLFMTNAHSTPSKALDNKPLEPRPMTARGLFKHFRWVTDEMNDERAFCFILGAGASRTSGIKLGSELVDQWLNELHTSECNNHVDAPVEKWATAENLGIEAFQYDRRAEFYSQVYAYRFPDPVEGYSYLEREMQGATPSVGYSVLAQILTKTQHRVVITTNFDDLVADSIFIYSEERISPLVCGHESHVPFVRARIRRPLVAKIHNDLLLSPKSYPEETRKLADGWKDALTKLFRFYTPIVIGYGGNDGSLIDYLASLETGDMEGRLIWCFVGEKPRQNIQNVVAKHRGVMVEIDGFDHLMLGLSNCLKYGSLTDVLEKRHRDVLQEYKKQFGQFRREILRGKSPEELEKDIPGANWWKWVWLIENESDPDKCEKLYQYGINEFPESPELRGNFAVFMQDRDSDKAQILFVKALAADRKGKFEGLRTRFDKFRDAVKKENEKANQRFFGVPLAAKYTELSRLHLEAGDIDKAKNHAVWALEQIIELLNPITGEIFLYLGLIARLEGGSDREALGKLKDFFKEENYVQTSASFESLSQRIMQLTEEDQLLYQGIVSALRDPADVHGLETFERWKNT